MRILVLLALIIAPSIMVAQPKAARIVAVEAAIRAGIDRERIDSIYIDGNGVGCTTCRFDSVAREAYDNAWNAFLGELMNSMLEADVAFSELVLRAYFSADGQLDYLLYHVGGGEKNNERFIAAASKVSASFRFALPAKGPYKQCATIALGPAFGGE